MRYLLDVSSLMALVLVDHDLHAQVDGWVTSLQADERPELATCSITELGFVRIVAQTEKYGASVGEAKELLANVKRDDAIRWTFIVDGQSVSRLPTWVATPKQTTDGHLLNLARANDAVLATLDRGIPGAFLIPQIH